MSIRAPELPPPIDSVVVPDSFSVSTLARLERCALSVLGVSSTDGTRADGVLVPHPLALLGTILHHVRAEVLDGRWGEAKDALDGFRTIFQSDITSAEKQLREEPYTANLVPLRKAVGRRRWMQRVEQGEQWAASLGQIASSAMPPRALGRLMGHAPSTETVSRAPRLGVEKSLQDAELRLRGRPDWSEKRGPELVVVSEFKSGKIADEGDQLLDEHVIQVQAYALMLERAQPGILVEPYIEGVDRVLVPWGVAERERLLERLRALDSRMPRGHELRADELALPGAHCRFCTLRPICAPYQREVLAWWPDLSDAPRPLPLDVWGVVDEVNERSTGGSLRLTDASGRRVLVDGLSADLGVSGLKPGDEIWFFDLESSEDLDQHGAKVQPRNFHQVPPGPRWALARRLRVFRG